MNSFRTRYGIAIYKGIFSYFLLAVCVTNSVCPPYSEKMMANFRLMTKWVLSSQVCHEGVP